MNFGIFYKSRNTFEGQLPDEKTIAIVRMHWFILATQGLGLIVFLIPLLAAIILGGVFFDSLIAGFIYFIASIIFLFWWYWIFYVVTMYQLNVWIITDHRIIQSMTTGLFKRDFSEMQISKIQDVSLSIKGFFPTTLNFGDITIQSAGAQNKFWFTSIPNPMEVKQIIMRALNSYTKKHPGGEEHI